MLCLVWNFLCGRVCRLCGCAKDGLHVCKTCAKDVHYMRNHPRFMYKGVLVFAASCYSGNMSRIIKLLKYKKKKELAVFCAVVLYNYWQKNKVSNKKYTVTSVPLHKRRRKRRGFNQSELIAKEFCKLSGYEYADGVITRDKYTKVMYNMHAHEREANLKDAFNFHKELYNNKNLLILDDITTTGATFKEIIRELEKHKVKNAVCLALSATKHDT